MTFRACSDIPERTVMFKKPITEEKHNKGDTLQLRRLFHLRRIKISTAAASFSMDVIVSENKKM